MVFQYSYKWERRDSNPRCLPSGNRFTVWCYTTNSSPHSQSQAVQAGIEPATKKLTVSRSTSELPHSNLFLCYSLLLLVYQVVFKKFKRKERESNPHESLAPNCFQNSGHRQLACPSVRGTCGSRTHNSRFTKPVLYQLSQGTL